MDFWHFITLRVELSLLHEITELVIILTIFVIYNLIQVMSVP